MLPALGALVLWVVCLNGGTLAINSVFDKDEGDIGYLVAPPAIPKHLLAFSVALLASVNVRVPLLLLEPLTVNVDRSNVPDETVSVELFPKLPARISMFLSASLTSGRCCAKVWIHSRVRVAVRALSPADGRRTSRSVQAPPRQPMRIVVRPFCAMTGLITVAEKRSPTCELCVPSC